MTTRMITAAALLAIGFGTTTGASAMNLQPGMLTMMQQGGTEHGVQVGCTLPGYDARHTCAYGHAVRSYGPSRRYDARGGRYGRD